ncbi:MAG: folylpolyglutamate synthase/dihydrofolate synthase family protein [bacterium]
MNFENSLHYLLSLGHETTAIKLGLKNTELLLESLDNPHKDYQSVQIAGTNGKGSTAVMLDSICRAAGIHTGLYTSPHLVSITERIKAGDSEISSDEFAKHATKVRAAAEDLVTRGKLEALPTFFEQVTAIALLAFREAGVRLAILETGLGGRLDATTVAGAEIVAITPLAMDHQEYLGYTLAAITAEKAAIIRPGVSAIIAAQPAQALDVILQRCAEFKIHPSLERDQSRNRIEKITDDGRFVISFETDEEHYEHVLLGLRGRHQIVNTSVAIRIAESLRKKGFDISKTSIREGITTARHAGRLEFPGAHPRLLLDGAHNPGGAQALREFLDEFVSRPLTLLFGGMNDKRLEEIAAILFPAADRLILTQPDNPRAADVSRLQDLAANIVDSEKITAVPSVGQAFQLAKDVTPPDGLICITGSLYLLGEIKAIMDKGRIVSAEG